MVRAKIWFKCRAVGDEVRPVIVRPCLIGWEAKDRDISLVIERTFDGEELLRRMKGWITADPKKVIEVVKKYGFLKVLDERDLVVELESKRELDELERELKSNFGDDVKLEIIKG